MKTVTFMLDSKNTVPLIRVFSAVSDVSCKIELDIENNAIIVRDLEETEFDVAQEFVKKIFPVKKIVFDNVTEVPSKPDNSKEALVINLVKPESLLLEEFANSLMRTVHWAINSKEVPERIVGNYLRSCAGLINMTYGSSPRLDVTRGDVVYCTFGQNIPGEINGGHVPCIICYIDDDLVYVLPIVHVVPKSAKNSSILQAKVPEDMHYFERDVGSIILLDRGQVVSKARITKLIGRTSKQFFNSVLNATLNGMAKRFGKSAKPISRSAAVTSSSTPPPQSVTTTNPQPVESVVSSIDSSISSAPKPLTKKPNPRTNLENKVNEQPTGKHEEALTKILSNQLKSLDKSKPCEEEVKRFMEAINMPYNKNTTMFEAFVAVITISKVTTTSVCDAVHEKNPGISSKDIVKESLKINFQRWLKDCHPEVLKENPKISFADLLKVFKKNF